MIAARRPGAGPLVMLAVGVLALSPVLLSAASASAHGGEIELEVVTDGAGGINVLPTFEADGHPVQDIIDPVLTAISSSGETVGPVSLVSASEGVGIWQTTEPVLTDGSWKVTVEITEPSKATETVSIDVAPLAGPVDDPAPLADAATVAAAPAGVAVLPWLGGAAGALLIAAIAFVLLRRRSATAPEGGR